MTRGRQLFPQKPGHPLAIIISPLIALRKFKKKLVFKGIFHTKVAGNDDERAVLSEMEQFSEEYQVFHELKLKIYFHQNQNIKQH